jgi:hypothetical protein
MTTLITTNTRDAVIAELEWDPQVDASRIGVSASGGSVVLSGYVPRLRRPLGRHSRSPARLRSILTPRSEPRSCQPHRRRGSHGVAERHPLEPSAITRLTR